MARACSLLRSATSQPLATLPDTDSVFQTEPLVVDKVASEAWSPVLNLARSDPTAAQMLVRWMIMGQEQIQHSNQFPLPK